MAVKNLKDAIRERTTPAKGQAYAVGADLIPAAELPEQAGALPEVMQTIARNYVAARRRSGEALLEAARWLNEAHVQAQHGEWKLFLDATNTPETTARRLLDIHDEAMRSPQFAEAVARYWLNYTAAAEIAAPSTPRKVRQQLLNNPTPPTRADVQAARRAAKTATVADFEHDVQDRAPSAPVPPPTETRGFAKTAPIHVDVHETWRDALSEFRGAKAQARAVQLQARHFVGQQRCTLLEEIESLQKGLEAAKEALKA